MTSILGNDIFIMTTILGNKKEDISMDKNEILSKSRKENVYGDEREKEVRVKRDAFSQWGLIVLGIIIMVIKLLRTESPADIISILFCTSGLGFTYEGIKLRKKYTVACGIALLLASIYFFYKFCAGLF